MVWLVVRIELNTDLEFTSCNHTFKSQDEVSGMVSNHVARNQCC